MQSTQSPNTSRNQRGLIKMIDVHCHLEQPAFDADREAVIERCRRSELKGIVTCCAHPQDFKLTLELVQRHAGFVWATAGLHPIHANEVSNEAVEAFAQAIEANAANIVAIGEVGLDYHAAKEPALRARQAAVFGRFVELAQKLRKPLVVHARNAFAEAIEFLERHNVSEAVMHMFGAARFTQRVVANNWHVSLNTIVARSKSYRKVARSVPLERLLLETDSPWLGEGGARNEPTAIRRVAEEVAAIKKTSFETVWRACGGNAETIFKLKT